MKVNKETALLGAGAGIGVIQVVGFRYYVDAYGLIPGIGPYLGSVWGNWSTGGNIIIGAVAFGLSLTKTLKKKSASASLFLQQYGIVALVGGAINGLTYPVIPAAGRRLVSRARTAGLNARNLAMAPITATGVPPATILA